MSTIGLEVDDFGPVAGTEFAAVVEDDVLFDVASEDWLEELVCAVLVDDVPADEVLVELVPAELDDCCVDSPLLVTYFPEEGRIELAGVAPLQDPMKGMTPSSQRCFIACLSIYNFLAYRKTSKEAEGKSI